MLERQESWAFSLLAYFETGDLILLKFCQFKYSSATALCIYTYWSVYASVYKRDITEIYFQVLFM